MNQVPPFNPFVSRDALTLADVLNAIEATPDLKLQERRDMSSALRSVARWFNRELSEIPANYEFLRRGFKAFHHRYANVSRRRVQNVRSLISKAFQLTDIPTNRQCYLAPLDEAWKTLHGMLPSSYERNSMGRFERYCSAQGIAPEDVDDTVSEAFLNALTQESLTKNPRTAHGNMVRAWNRVADTIADWPDIRLTVPCYTNNVVLPRETFCELFHEDVQRYLACLAVDDLFDPRAPTRPLRPLSIKTREQQLYRFASALCRAGRDPADLVSLASLIEHDNFKTGLRYLIDRNGGQTSSSIADLAWCLRTVAVHHVCLDGPDLVRLQDICRRLRRNREGPSPRNRDRLEPFEDIKTLARLVCLPPRLIGQGLKKPKFGRREALLIQKALAIEIALVAPMRIANIAGLNLERHLRWSEAGRKGELRISIPGDEVKNGQALTFAIPEKTAAMIRIYCEQCRPLLSRTPNPWLFPGPDSARPKRADTLGKQISALIWQELGLRVHPHLLRHIAAYIVLRESPEAYGQVSRILAHKNVNTAYRHYSGLETGAAHRLYLEKVLRLRAPDGELGT